MENETNKQNFECTITHNAAGKNAEREREKKFGWCHKDEWNHLDLKLFTKSLQTQTYALIRICTSYMQIQSVHTAHVHDFTSPTLMTTSNKHSKHSYTLNLFDGITSEENGLSRDCLKNGVFNCSQGRYQAPAPVPIVSKERGILISKHFWQNWMPLN